MNDGDWMRKAFRTKSYGCLCLPLGALGVGVALVALLGL